jgi:hypothetical protein
VTAINRFRGIHALPQAPQSGVSTVDRDCSRVDALSVPVTQES